MNNQRRYQREQVNLLRKLVALLFVVLGVSAVLTGPPPARAAEGSIVDVGQFPVSGNSQLYIDDAARLIYDLGASPDNRVIIRNADTLALLTTLSFPTLAIRGDLVNIRSAVGAVDSVHHRLFFPTGDLAAVPTVGVVDGVNARLIGTIPLGTPADAWRNSAEIVGMSYDPARDKVFVEFQIPAAPGVPLGAFGVAELDPTAVTKGQSGFDWSYIVPLCTTAAPSLGGIPGVPSDLNRSVLYLFCTYPSEVIPLTGPRPVQGVVRIPIKDGKPPPPGTAPDIFRMPGDYMNGGVAFDPQSERMFIASRNFGPQGEYIFDGIHGAIVGLINHTGNVMGGCIDPHSGRYFVGGDAQTDSLSVGLLVADMRPTPPDHGRAYPQFAKDPVAQTGPYACDGVGHKVAMKYKTTDGKTFARIVQDKAPVYVAPPKTDPDSYTHDIADTVATTTVNFNALGRAYGARILDVGGQTSLQNNFSNSNLLGNYAQAVQVAGATRYLTLAPIGIGNQSVALSDSSGASGAAAGALRDSGTTQDMQRPHEAIPENANGVFPPQASSHPTVPDEVAGNQVAGQTGTIKDSTPEDQWPYGQVSCARAPGDSRVTEQDESHGVSVVCDTPNGSSQSEARGQDLVGPITIEGAYTRVNVHTDPELGVVSEATADVGRLSIPAAGIVLEGLKATATSWARGRPNTAKASYERTLARATIAGKTYCDGDCRLSDVVNAINQLPTQNVRAFLPGMDVSLAAGTPRGAAAAIVRDQFEQLNDEVLNRVSPDDEQVPALRLLIGEDAYQHAFTIVDLAAPETATLRSLSPCSFCDDASDGSLTPVLDNPPLFSQSDGSGGGPDLSDIISPTPPAPSPSPSPRIITRLLRPVGQGLTQLAAGITSILTSPRKLPLVAAVWSVLAVPVYLASRRRLIPTNALGEDR